MRTVTNGAEHKYLKEMSKSIYRNVQIKTFMVRDLSFDEFKKILTIYLIELFISYWTVKQVPDT